VEKRQLASPVVYLLLAAMCALLALILTTAVLAAPRESSGPVAPQGESTLGDYVWRDQDVDGVQDVNEQGIDDGVLVKLWLDDGDNAFDPQPGGGDIFQGQMLTGDNPDMAGTQHGWYDFKVTAGGNTYWVEIDDSNFAPGGKLYRYVYTGDLASENYSGPEPRMVYMGPDPIMDYSDADFGYALAGIDLVKLAGDTPDGQIRYISAPGAWVNYTYTVTNTGQTHLSNIVITDDNGTPGVPGDDFQVCTIPGPLAPGSSWSCTKSIYVSTNRTNWATAVGNPTSSGGTDLPGDNASDVDNAVVEVLALPTATPTPTSTPTSTPTPTPGRLVKSPVFRLNLMRVRFMSEQVAVSIPLTFPPIFDGSPRRNPIFSSRSPAGCRSENILN